MTAGFDQSGTGAPPPERPGPLPPRFEPRPPYQYPPASGPAPAPYPPAQPPARFTGPAGPQPGPAGPVPPPAPPAGPAPAVTGPAPSGPVPPGSTPPGSTPPGVVPPVVPGAGVPLGPAPLGPGVPGPIPPHQPLAATAPRRGLGAAGTVIAVLLLVVALVEGVELIRLDGQVGDARSAAAKARTDADARLKSLESRTQGLEARLGKTLDASGVAAAVLPSVFRVSAGKYTGTAWAVGKPGDGTDLITNYHVVDSVYSAGDRDVYLERTNGRFPARIVKVDEKKDLALLHTDEKFTPLATAAEQVKPGESVVVVGAPLGLEDTVTAGVVSALRNNEDPPIIQFDAPINPGNSGGPVINAQKQVIGVATAKANGAEGIGIAIQVSVVCQTFDLC